MDKKIVIGFIVVIIIILGGIIFVTSRSTSSGPDLTSFAQCLKQKGATFYGAFWCPHCQATKRMFGNAVDALPYVECSTPDGNSQTQICIDKGIKQYPTWEFADGSRLTGELTLEQLSDKTGCPVPGGADTSNASASENGASTVVSSSSPSTSSTTSASSVSTSSSPDVGTGLSASSSITVGK